MRLRSTAPPTAFVTVKPKRGGLDAASGSARGRASKAKGGVGHRAPPLIRKNSDRFLRVVSFKAPPRNWPRAGVSGSLRNPPGSLGRKALAALGATTGNDLYAASGLHALAKAMPTLAHKLARLIRALHDTLRLEARSGSRRPHSRDGAPKHLLLRIQRPARNGLSSRRTHGHPSQIRQDWKTPLYRGQAVPSQSQGWRACAPFPGQLEGWRYKDLGPRNLGAQRTYEHLNAKSRRISTCPHDLLIPPGPAS